MITSEKGFTAVIRAKDREHTIGKAIASVLAQTVPAEIIVVDSGSSDRTVEVAQRMGARIIEIPEEDFTYGRAINIGVAAAMTPYVLVLSAHCALPRPDWAQKAIQLFEDPRVTGVNGFITSSAAVDIDPELHPELALELGGTSVPVIQSEPWFSFTGFSNHASLLRRSVAVELPFDEALGACEDKEWANRVVAAGHHLVYSPQLPVPSLHRRREGPKALYQRAQRESAALSQVFRRPVWTAREARAHAVRLARYRRGPKRLGGLRPAGIVESVGRYRGARSARSTAAANPVSPHAAVLAELLAPVMTSRVDLLNFPLHNNCGDSAIWLGERALLRSLGVPARQARAFTNTLDQFDVSDRAPLGLVHGGGNFGDLWPEEFDGFLDACKSYRGSRVVLMPQTLTRMTGPTIERTRHAVKVHGDVTILLRDRRSFDSVRELFPEVSAHLAPDAAECLSKSDLMRLAPRVRRLPPVRVIARRDAEGDGSLASLAAARGIPVLDFVDSRSGIANRALREIHELARARLPRPIGQALICRFLASSGALDRHAEGEISRALGMIVGAERIVTDRLHACILSSILEIPVTAVDTGYGKLTGYFSAWPSDYVSFASDAQEALEGASLP